jgi:cobalt/nickel transport system permease protein/cobalt/nickel transport protein
MALALGGLILLSPLGLIIPAQFGAGSAWGEWEADEMKRMLGYAPAGLQKMGELWKAPMPDYSFAGWQDKGMPRLSLAYIFAGLLGAGLIALLAWLIGKLLAKEDDRPAP